MKSTLRGFMTFFLVMLIGCGSGYSGSGNSQNNPSGNSTENSSSPSNSGNSQPRPNSADVDVINIPSKKQNAPNGILDQLAWGGTGGEDGPTQPCGNCYIDIRGSNLVAENFEAYQNLRILVYRDTGGNSCWSTADYVTTIYIQVDALGSLRKHLSGSVDDLMVVLVYDEDTNEAVWGMFSIYTYTECPLVSDSPGSCVGAPPQRLEVYEMAYVCTSSDSVKLREGPGKNYSVIKSLIPGADLKVIGGPKCGDNWSWWQVETESGFVGWMSEGGDSVDRYFLCPRK